MERRKNLFVNGVGKRENNMKYELEHFIHMLHGQEHNHLHTQRSLDALELMDKVRRQCNITFPSDK